MSSLDSDGTSFHQCRKNGNEQEARAFVKEVMQDALERVTRLEKIMDAFLIAGALVNKLGLSCNNLF